MRQRFHPERPRRCHPATVFVLLAALMLPGTLTLNGATFARQAGTPAGATPTALLPILPAAEECTVPPRAFETLPLGQGTPAPLFARATPLAGHSEAASAEAAVIATMRLYLACVNAGDLPRVFTMSSDAYVSQLLQQANLPPLTAAIYQNLGTPVPRPDIQMVRIQSISNVEAHPDGSISARIVTVDLDTTTNDIVIVPSATSPTGYVLDRQVLVETIPGTPVA